jgi:hypothetical protein
MKKKNREPERLEAWALYKHDQFNPGIPLLGAKTPGYEPHLNDRTVLAISTDVKKLKELMKVANKYNRDRCTVIPVVITYSPVASKPKKK